MAPTLLHRTPSPLLRAAGATAAGSLALALAGCGASDPLADLEAPAFEDVTVHDPSVVTSGDEVWIFGSHAASASTTDLMSWTQNSSSVDDADAAGLFDDIRSELAETFAWAESDTLWAADVIELPDGRFAYYYNACRGDAPLSALGVAIADDVDGPYVDQGILLRSGMTDEPSANGDAYDATVHPNAVDPDAFYDAEGDMWMVYGSYSGGIFILEMDAATGLPVEGQGYGTHLVGGNHARIEAPTIRYDEETGYYYLFLSFGGLDAGGGYEVRVARSENPDGPYLDANGTDMSTVAGAPGTTFDDVSIEPAGVKLMGGFEWADGPLAGTDAGYVSPGHNSWYDDADGQSYLVFHSRFPGQGEMHQVRTHAMHMNADGWPVLSPGRYAGETLTDVDPDRLAGAWQMVRLDRTISPFASVSASVTLDADGKVSGDATGTWSLDGTDLTMELDGETLHGVVTPVWNETAEAWTLGLSALNPDGVATWARQIAAP